ncbi:MAG TPA: hypothetical protein VNZ44_01405, partial [Pyrinomonadaceae bacterium]|nr:hypothetical protein [Pyrinomonadaceae bacterium]
MNRRRGLTAAARLCCAAALALACASAANAQGPAPQCNEPMSAPVSYVQLPGHPFSTVPSPDGCWLFVSLNSSNPKSANGVAVLSRRRGQITLKQVFPVEAEPTGMTLTHDGKLLVVADGEYVVFMDAARMTGGGGDPILGYIR